MSEVVPTGLVEKVVGGVTVVAPPGVETPMAELERRQKEDQKKNSEGVEKEKPLLSTKEGTLYDVTLWLLWDKTSGKLRGIWTVEPPAILLMKEYGVWKLKTRWTKPTWGEQTSYRQNNNKWVVEAQAMMVDRRGLHMEYLYKHLKEAEGMLDKDGNEIKVEKDTDGTLKQEALTKIMGMEISIIDQLIFQYEKEVLLVST